MPNVHHERELLFKDRLQPTVQRFATERTVYDYPLRVDENVVGDGVNLVGIRSGTAPAL